MQDDFADKLLMVLSSERIRAYRDRMNDDSHRNLFAHYAWNMALSESLYPSLQILEVVLRNSIHSTIRQHSGHDDWFELPDYFEIALKDFDVLVSSLTACRPPI